MTAPFPIEPSDEAIDLDLRREVYDYDLRDDYPEFSHDAMRTAWRAGYAVGLARGTCR